MIDAAELARWEKAARKDNPSYWGSDTLVKVFDELRRVEAELGDALAAASIHANEHRKQRERMRRVEDHNRKLEEKLAFAKKEFKYIAMRTDCETEGYITAEQALKEIGE